MKNPVIYTSVYGSYDSISPVPETSKYRYVCVTDEPDLAKEAGWEVIYRKATEPISVRNARFVKIHPHLYLDDHDVSLWVDGNLTLLKDPEPVLTHCLKDFDMAMFDHYFLNDLVSELRECIRCRKDDPETMTNQVKAYLEDGFPQLAYNHFMTMFIARRHNEPSVVKAMDKWWYELKNNSYRDQLSFSYACWKTGFRCNRINAKHTDFFNTRMHLK